MRFLLLVALLTAVGCRGLRPAIPGLPQGGREVNALRLNRLDMAARRVGVAGIDVALASRREAGAWAWPNGPIRVSRALVDLVDDDELAAAIAHELGHLQDDGRWHAPRAALERAASIDVEARADERGCRLLASRGIPPAATVRLLEKLGPSVRDGLSERIARARTVCPSNGAAGPLPH